MGPLTKETKFQGGTVTKFRVCALEGCFETFFPPRGAQHKQYCTERHQRIAEKRRYRERHTEIARCPGCDELFSRSSTTSRKHKYCSSECMAAHRSAQYRERPDIQRSVARAREVRAAMTREP